MIEKRVQAEATDRAGNGSGIGLCIGRCRLPCRTRFPVTGNRVPVLPVHSYYEGDPPSFCALRLTLKHALARVADAVNANANIIVDAVAGADVHTALARALIGLRARRFNR
jgi:hypothetical protein